MGRKYGMYMKNSRVGGRYNIKWYQQGICLSLYCIAFYRLSIWLHKQESLCKNLGWLLEWASGRREKGIYRTCFDDEGRKEV